MRIKFNLDRQAIRQTQKRLKEVSAKIQRQALRKGVEKAGSETVKEARAAAPRGRTGVFRRAIAKRDKRYASRGTYVSLIGVNWKKQSTPRQIASANRKTGQISKGLSGRGKAPSIWWLEAGTKAHVIRASRGRRLAWNIVKGNKKLRKPRFAQRVLHPGHNGTQFLTRVERQGRPARIRTIQRVIEAEIAKY